MINTELKTNQHAPPCPVCHSLAQKWRYSSDHVYSVTEYKAQYWSCRSCELKFVHPMPERNVVAEFYPNGYWQEHEKVGTLSRLEHFYTQIMLRRDLLQWIKNAIQPGQSDMTFLDIGCSRGDLLAEARVLGLQVYGIESDERAIAYARRTYHLDIMQGDVETWTPNETYGIISAFHVLEHLRNPLDFLTKVHRALPAGGRLVLRVPNIASVQAHLMGSKWKGLEIPRHLFHYSPKSLAHLLSTAGFKIHEWSTWSLRDGPPALTSSLCQRGEPTWQLIKKRPSLFWKLVYLKLNWFLTIPELLAAVRGKGGMITVIATKK